MSGAVIVLPPACLEGMCRKIHVWCCSPIWALTSLKRHSHSSVFPAHLHLCIPRICNASLWRISSHLVLDFPTEHVLWHIPLMIFFGILSTSLVVICFLPYFPAHKMYHDFLLEILKKKK